MNDDDAELLSTLANRIADAIRLISHGDLSGGPGARLQPAGLEALTMAISGNPTSESSLGDRVGELTEQVGRAADALAELADAHNRIALAFEREPVQQRGKS